MSKQLRKLFYRHINLICISATVVAVLILQYVGAFNRFLSENQWRESLSGMACTLTGFSLTALTVFLAIPKSTSFMKEVFAQGHHLIFTRSVLIAIIFFVGVIIGQIISVQAIIVLVAFLCGLVELGVSVYYCYNLCVGNF